MIGGLIKSNRVAALAGAGFIASALAVSPAQAADLGGDCCADLEERVATLEATTARKGNRKVSLTISGWVNSGIFIWDDGTDSDAYVVSDNGSTLGSRFTFAGTAKINSRWSAGYNITVEVQSGDPFVGALLNEGNSVANGASQTNDDNENFNLLYSYMYVKSEELGTISIGLQSQATDNISIVDLSGTLFNTNNVLFRGNNFATGSGGTWGNAVGCTGIGTDCHGDPLNVIKYDSPAIAGFTLSASWGEDDFYDVALKYAGQFGDFKVAAAAGYSNWGQDDYFRHIGVTGVGESEVFEAGGSVMHVPTGIFISGTYSQQEADNSSGVQIIDSDAWYIKAGIKQKWNSLGQTAIYGEFAEYNSGAVDRYGIGLHQWIDAASMQVYANWTHLEGQENIAGVLSEGDELDTFTVGGVIFF
ncbi:MAG: porin [Rhodomicrobiaceae bacterium]